MNNTPPENPADDQLLEALITTSELLGQTNKSPEAIDRELERRILSAPDPVFLGSMTDQEILELRRSYFGEIIHNVAIPDSVATMLSVIRESGQLPIPDDVVRKMERLVALHHGVPSDTIEATARLVDTGRAWRFFPEAERVLTGFDCYPEKESPFHQPTP